MKFEERKYISCNNLSINEMLSDFEHDLYSYPDMGSDLIKLIGNMFIELKLYNIKNADGFLVTIFGIEQFISYDVKRNFLHKISTEYANIKREDFCLLFCDYIVMSLKLTDAKQMLIYMADAASRRVQAYSIIVSLDSMLHKYNKSLAVRQLANDIKISIAEKSHQLT